jgi:hypothetical protein
MVDDSANATRRVALTRIVLGPSSATTPRLIAPTELLDPEQIATPRTPALAIELRLMAQSPFGAKCFTASFVAKIVPSTLILTDDGIHPQ